MKKDFIFDLETVGANVHICPIVDMAYYAFEWDRFLENPYSFEELASNIQTVKLDVRDQVENWKCGFEQEDLKFWQRLPKAARDKLKPTENDLTVQPFCDIILAYLREQRNVDYWWSRSNTFDPIIIWRIMNESGNGHLFSEYLKYYKVRDIRTFIDAKFNFGIKHNGFIPVADEDYWHKTFVAHDSTHDVAADILRLQMIHRAENGHEQTER